MDKQIELDVVKSNEYFNESLASVDGMFGRDVSGKLNPMFGKTSEVNKGKVLSKETRKKISEAKKSVKRKKLVKNGKIKYLTVLKVVK